MWAAATPSMYLCEQECNPSAPPSYFTFAPVRFQTMLIWAILTRQNPANLSPSSIPASKHNTICCSTTTPTSAPSILTFFLAHHPTHNRKQRNRSSSPKQQHIAMASSAPLAPQAQPDLESASQPLLEPHGACAAVCGEHSCDTRCRLCTLAVSVPFPPSFDTHVLSLCVYQRTHFTYTQSQAGTGGESLPHQPTPGCRTRRRAYCLACCQQSHSRYTRAQLSLLLLSFAHRP